jgi:hypothetical protein
MIPTDKIRIWRKVVVTYGEVLTQNLLVGLGKTMRNFRNDSRKSDHSELKFDLKVGTVFMITMNLTAMSKMPLLCTT